METLVSVLCTAYNHERYIEKALKSFVAQKTTFPVEVIVHDDASTDGTKEIIKRYADNYPKLIRPIYERVNQYSQGVRLTADILLPASSGKYVALCEGDDYWTDPHKLQKQVEYMQSHPKCALCVHNSVRVSEKGDLIDRYIVSRKERDFTADEVIRAGGGFCMTASMMAPASLMKEAPNYLHRFSFDYPLKIFLATKGSVHCIPKIMSAYRVFSKNSWSDRLSKASIGDKIKSDLRIIDFLEAFDCETGRKYHRSVHAYEASRLRLIIYRSLDLRMAFSKECLPVYQEMSAPEKFRLCLLADRRLHPFVYDWIRMKELGFSGIAWMAGAKIKHLVRKKGFYQIRR